MTNASNIRALRADAVAAGDWLLVAICDIVVGATDYGHVTPEEAVLLRLVAPLRARGFGAVDAAAAAAGTAADATALAADATALAAMAEAAVWGAAALLADTHDDGIWCESARFASAVTYSAAATRIATAAPVVADAARKDAQ